MSSSDGSEERRKIQFTGGSTYIVSLPKKWIAQNQLKRGSFINLRQEEGGALVIVPNESSVPEKKNDQALIKVSLKDSPEVVERKTVSAYLAGFNSILMKANEQKISVKQRHDIKVFARRMLVGTEIVTDTPTELTLQVLLSFPELTVQNAIRRMSIITSSMHKDAIRALKMKDEAMARDVLITDNEVDRFYLYVIRQLKTVAPVSKMTKLGVTKGKFFSGYYLITKSIERTADHAVRIAENVLSLKHELSQESAEKIDKMSTIARSMFETAVESLFREDYYLAESIVEQVDEVVLLEKEVVALAQTDGEDLATLRLIIESIRRTAEYASDIAEIVLNLTIESILA